MSLSGYLDSVGHGNLTYNVSGTLIAPVTRSTVLTRVLSSPVSNAQVFLHILASVLAGLEHMHTLTDSAGRSLAAIHYDIKPDNVLVFPGEHDNVLGLQFKVSDLGATRATATLRQRRAEDPGHTVVSVGRRDHFLSGTNVLVYVGVGARFWILGGGASRPSAHVSP